MLVLKNKRIQELRYKPGIRKKLKIAFLGCILVLLYLKIKDLGVSEPSIVDILKSLSGNLGYFFTAIALLFLNYFLEIKKWQVLTSPIEERSMAEAIGDVLKGLRIGLFTPFMIGDFIGRSLGFSKKNRTEAMAANFFNSICQTYTAIFLGALSFLFWWGISEGPLKGLLLFPTLVFCVAAFLGLFFVFKVKVSWQFLDKINFLKVYLNPETLEMSLSNALIFKVLILSFARSLVYNVQFYLFYISLGINLPKLVIFIGVNLILLIKTVGGGLNVLGDLSLRELVSLHFFGLYKVNAGLILIATFIVWFFNIFVPVLLGLLFKSKS